MFTPSVLGKTFQGQFGEFTITTEDCQGVIIYRSALLIAALCFSSGALAVLWQASDETVLQVAGILYGGFVLALGIALFYIHIYLKVLHRALQLFLAIGALASIAIAYLAWQNHMAFLQYIYENPTMIWGIGFTFVALTGVYFKEAFCFNRLETKLLVLTVPFLLLGHLLKALTIDVEQMALASWSSLFLIFALRKFFQDIPADIGDKSVFVYLENLEDSQKSHGTSS